MISRNPFRVRATEYIEGEWNFISLFGLGALDIFDKEDMWTKIQIIRSARGGGKTSLLRIFSPKSLNEIYSSHNNDRNIEALYKKLQSFNVLSDEKGIQVLGIYLSLFGNYPILNQLGFSEKKQTKLFYSLLICRIIIATLRSICELKKLEFPDSLEQIKIKHPLDPNIPKFIKLPCTGRELYEWAASTEQKISSIIEDDSEDDRQLGGHECLTALHIIKAKNIFYNGEPVAEQTLLMLDDVDKLTSKQRTELSDTLTNLRVPIGLWIAERLEALRPEELLSPVGTWNREYGTPIMLETFWRRNPKKFEALLSDISNKRASWQPRYNIASFEYHLQNNLKDKWDAKFHSAIDKESNKIKTKFGHETKYRFWFDLCETSESNPSQLAEKWRILEILIERDMKKRQRSLFEDEDLTDENFKERISTKENEVSRYYIRTKYNIPYYFGFSYLVKLASSNVQQFLELSSTLFDDMISTISSETSPSIPADRQEHLLEKKIFEKWEEINQSIPNAQYVIPFLNNIAKFCFTETNLPNSPYTSVTGIAISSEDLKKLRTTQFPESNKKYKILADVLTTCFAHNLLEPLPGSKQGKKGTTHLVMYLNRLLCFRFQLPIPHGGWREQDLDTLCDFVEDTFKSKRKIHPDIGQQRLIEMKGK